MENREYEKKKIGELQKRLANALASPHHRELVTLFYPLILYELFFNPSISYKMSTLIVHIFF